MILFQRKFPVLGGVVLMLLLLCSKWYLWDDFAHELSSGSPHNFYILLALIGHAIMLRYILVSNRLIQSSSILVVFFYLYFAIQNFGMLQWSTYLLMPPLLMLLMHTITNMYNAEQSTNGLLAVGTLLGLGIVIDESFTVFLPFVLLGLSYFMILDFRRSLIVTYFAILTAFVGLGARYLLTDFTWADLNIAPNAEKLSQLFDVALVQSLVLVNLIIAFLFIMFRAQFLNVRSVKVRNVHRLFSIALPFALAFYLFSHKIQWESFGIMSISLATVFAYHFENAKNAWLYESVFVIILFTQAFGHWYYQ